MPSESGNSTSFWMEDGLPVFPPLDADASVDVCVIGAGIAGLSVAYHLAREGRSVLVVDDGRPGGGETGRTTAHLSTALDDRYHEIERLHGSESAQFAAQSHAAAIDRIEAICAEERIACDFRRVDGYLMSASTRELDRELAAVQRAGLRDVRPVSRPPLETFDLGPALCFPRQGQMHPVQYLKGLAAAILRHGGRICEQTHAAEIDDGQGGHDGEDRTRVLTQNGHTVSAGATVVATNTPINDRFAIHTKQAPYRTFVVGMEILRGSVPEAQFWDTLDPYHYVRIAGDLDARHQLLIVGGEDHKTGQADDAAQRHARLVDWARAHFPVRGEPMYRWSGQVMEPFDGLAFIGLNPGDRHVYIVTGDSGNGMTHGTIAGMLIGDLIAGRANRWSRLYDPSRKMLKSIREYARENANVAAQYAHWLTSGDASDIQQLSPGQGAVLRAGLHKIAVYRDERGHVAAYHATCPHLGCIVEWNSAESTFDCPCHGSRFDRGGRVINGPANVGLNPLDGALSDPS